MLIGEELAERVRNAFDAYIFLSYRKKDRQYANRLMRIIHKNSLCRDIAIWYDEYLVPGEKFDEAIEKAMKKSELFTLLVTPNLVNEENYVQTVEYPYACKSGMGIFPVEMVDTDRRELEMKYKNLPECVKLCEDDFFYRQFLQSVSRTARTRNDNAPEHNFLIGLAYLDGIDVEVDKARALELITAAAEDELPEAMEKLAHMYCDASGVERNMPLYLKWYEKFVKCSEKELDEDDLDLLAYKNELSNIYADFGRLDEAVKLCTNVYEVSAGVYYNLSEFGGCIWVRLL